MLNLGKFAERFAPAVNFSQGLEKVGEEVVIPDPISIC